MRPQAALDKKARLRPDEHILPPRQRFLKAGDEGYFCMVILSAHPPSLSNTALQIYTPAGICFVSQIASCLPAGTTPLTIEEIRLPC